jgi:hypothetical protein
MNYEKPEVLALAGASAAIQGGKGHEGVIDVSSYTTTNSYEADE